MGGRPAAGARSATATGPALPAPTRQAGGGLLAEEPEQVGGALQVTALGRVRRGEEPDRSSPRAKAVSVDIVTPQPAAESRPVFRARKIPIGTTMPPRPASTGSATRRRCRSSPRSNSRRASRPTTKKKKVIKPLLTHSRRVKVRPTSPSRIVSGVSHAETYASGARLAHRSAASVARSSTPALPDSVRRNERSGAGKLRDHAVLPEKDLGRGVGSVRATPQSWAG
jgi:hypothetical protein